MTCEGGLEKRACACAGPSYNCKEEKEKNLRLLNIRLKHKLRWNKKEITLANCLLCWLLFCILILYWNFIGKGTSGMRSCDLQQRLVFICFAWVTKWRVVIRTLLSIEVPQNGIVKFTNLCINIAFIEKKKIKTYCQTGSTIIHLLSLIINY